MLCDSVDYSLTGSPVHGILQQEYRIVLPFLSLGHLPDPGIEPKTPALQVVSLPIEPPGKFYL